MEENESEIETKIENEKIEKDVQQENKNKIEELEKQSKIFNF
jgi:hypothetical protein